MINVISRLKKSLSDSEKISKHGSGKRYFPFEGLFTIFEKNTLQVRLRNKNKNKNVLPKIRVFLQLNLIYSIYISWKNASLFVLK